MSEETLIEKSKQKGKRPRKYGKAGTLFDIKEFKKKLDECSFNKFSFSLDKQGRDYYLVTITYDPSEGIGVVKKRSKFTTSLALAIQTLEEMNYCLLNDLPFKKSHRKLLP
jgi:hypothetical protein